MQRHGLPTTSLYAYSLHSLAAPASSALLELFGAFLTFYRELVNGEVAMVQLVWRSEFVKVFVKFVLRLSGWAGDCVKIVN